ncbi:MAG: hypothetical protein AAB377_02960 [Patescibacteria group bacterium]
MTTITIPQKITKGEELVAIPRKEYERFLRVVKKKYTKLDVDLDKVIREVKKEKIKGPFSSVKALRYSLER